MIKLDISNQNGNITQVKGQDVLLASNIKSWLDKNCQGNYIVNVNKGFLRNGYLSIPIQLLFNHDEDATLFQLTWL